jgi:hypothetical protein
MSAWQLQRMNIGSIDLENCAYKREMGPPSLPLIMEMRETKEEAGWLYTEIQECRKGRWRGYSPLRCENSTAYTAPFGPTMSETCETDVPDAAPKYSTLQPGLICILSTPANMAAANLLRKGFQTRYSTFCGVPPSSTSVLTRFSP